MDGFGQFSALGLKFQVKQITFVCSLTESSKNTTTKRCEYLQQMAEAVNKIKIKTINHIFGSTLWLGSVTARVSLQKVWELPFSSAVSLTDNRTKEKRMLNNVYNNNFVSSMKCFHSERISKGSVCTIEVKGIYGQKLNIKYSLWCSELCVSFKLYQLWFSGPWKAAMLFTVAQTGQT